MNNYNSHFNFIGLINKHKFIIYWLMTFGGT